MDTIKNNIIESIPLKKSNSINNNEVLSKDEIRVLEANTLEEIFDIMKEIKNEQKL